MLHFQPQRGGYANLAGTTAVLSTPVIDLSAYNNVEIEFDVAKFGSGSDGPITVEVSTDGGVSWTAQTFDSPTPTGSTYLTSGPTLITTTSATTQIRFTTENSPSAKRLRDVVLTGQVLGSSPLLTTTPTTLTNFDYITGSGPSASQSFEVSGMNLDPLAGNINVAAPANFEVSLDDNTFADDVDIAYTAGEFTDETVYVRLKSGLAENTYNGDITISGGDAADITVALSGAVIAPSYTTLPYNQTFDADLGDTYVYNVAGTTTWEHSNGTANANGYNAQIPEEQWLVLPGIDFSVYNDALMTFTTTAQYGTIDANNYLKLFYSTDYTGLGDPTTATWTELTFDLPGSVSPSPVSTPSGVVDLAAINGSEVFIAFQYYSSDSPTSWSVDDITIQEAVPTLTANPTGLSGLNYMDGNGPSASQQFELSGVSLDNSNVTLTAPADFEISEDDNTYSNSITLSAYDGTPTDIYVRLQSGLAEDTYSGDITISGGGITGNITVALSGEVTPLFIGTIETFANSNATGSYTNNSFIGNGGITWTYVESRDANNDANGSGIDLPALMLRRASDDSKITSESIPGGIGDFSVKLYKGFTGSGNRQVELFINGVSQGTSSPFDDYNEHIFAVSGINISGNVVIEIRNITSSQIIIDDISWTAYSATEPLLTASPTTVSDLNYNVGEGPSSAQSFELSGLNLDGSDVTVSVPGGSDFEISETEGGVYTNSITLTTYDGTATDIYARLKSGLAIDDYTDDVTISGGDADDITVTLNGTVAPTPPDNDLCADAIALTVNGGITSGTLVNATYSAPFGEADVWYTITPAYNETYTITLSNFTDDLDMFLFNQGSACPTTTDDIAEAYTTNIPEEISIDLEAGTTYYLRVAIYDFEESFDIAVTAPAAPDPCETPDNQPTSLQFTEVTNSAISGSFTASDADSYLVVISEAASLSENPVDETTYSADDVLGNGTVLQASSSTSFTATDLDAETQYYIFVFAYNNECLDGPLYYTATPLNGTTTTSDAPAVPTAGTIFITEVADANEHTNEYIEFYNNSNTPIDFTGAKISMDNGTTWEFGDDIDTAIIPARGFLILNRGANQTTFENEFGALNANTVLVQGISGAMYFGTGTNRSWQLWYGGTSGNADGDLIDDTINEVGGSGNRDYQNIFTNDFISDSDTNANPGELDYLVYVDGGWVNDVEIDDSTGTEDAIFYDTYTANTAIEINDLYIDSMVDLEIEDVLKVNGDIDNDGTIVFISNASGTGQFDEFTGSIDGDGEVTVERYIPARRAFRLLSSAVTTTSTINANWQEGVNNPDTSTNNNPNPGYGTHITGSTTGANGFDATATGNPSLFYMDNSNQSWEEITNTDVNTIQAGTPYRLMVRGSRAVDLNNDEAVADNTTLRATGALFTGTHNSTTISGTEGHYNFFGNPYQAAIDMEAVIAASTNINDGFYLIWDPTLADRGAFVAVDLDNGGNSNSSSEANQYLQPGQAAFVYTSTDAPGTLQIQETHKAVAQDQTAVFNDVSKIDLQLYEAISYAENGKSSDALRIKFSEDGNNGVDSKDAKKMGNLDENLATYSYEEEKFMSIESRVTPTEDDVIQIFSNQYRHNNYVFEAHVSYLDNDMEAYLKDQWTEDEILLENGTTTSYAFEIDPEDEESAYNDRFLIIFKQTTMGVEEAFGSNFALFPNPGNNTFYINTQGLQQQQVNVALTNIVGQKVYQQTHTVKENGTVQVAATALQSGIYVVTLTSNDGSVTQLNGLKNKKENYESTIYKNSFNDSLLLLAITVDAQIQMPEEELPGFDNNVIDAPINGLIGLGLIVGAYFGYKKLKKDH